LGGAEGFDHVIIRALFQGLHNILVIVAHAEDNHRAIALAANVAAHGQAIQLGQVEVQHHQIGLAFFPGRDGGQAIVHRLHFKAGPAQGEGENIGQREVIFYNQ
jgi:hypothetical protein